jgi:hypothetical protein
MTLTRQGNWDPHPSGIFPSQGIYPPDIPLPRSHPTAVPTQHDSEDQVIDQAFVDVSTGRGGHAGNPDGVLRDIDGTPIVVTTACRCSTLPLDCSLGNMYIHLIRMPFCFNQSKKYWLYLCVIGMRAKHDA